MITKTRRLAYRAPFLAGFITGGVLVLGLSVLLLVVWPRFATQGAFKISLDSAADSPVPVPAPEILSFPPRPEPGPPAGAIAYGPSIKPSFNDTVVNTIVTPWSAKGGNTPLDSSPIATWKEEPEPNPPVGAITYGTGREPLSDDTTVTPPSKDTFIDPNPILVAIWQGQLEQAQRYLDEQQAQGHTLPEDDRILLADLLPAMAAQKAGNWRLATTRYSQARRNIDPSVRTIRNHLDLLFWLSFAMLRYTEEDDRNAIENLELSRPERVSDITAFEQDFYRRTVAMVKDLASKRRNTETTGVQSETKTTNTGSLAVILKMVTLPAGRFLMGDIQGGGDKDELPVHEVVISHPFVLGRYEVTNGEYVAFLNDRKTSDDEVRLWIRTKTEEPSSRIEGLAGAYRVTAGYARHPVVNVSWPGAMAYGEWMSEKTGRRFRLPTEAEWEYAARAGTDSQYWWGNEVGENRANCDGCDHRGDGQGTMPVGSFPANAFGLHDVHGNVWEWVQDCGDSRYSSARTDGGAKAGGACKSRIVRGGGWNFKPWYARSAARFRFLPASRHGAVGFRLARDP